MRISVFGLGYVGAVTSSCFAKLGHEVVGVDINSEILESINSGRSPIVEQNLEETIQAGLASGRLRTTADARDAVQSSDVSLVCVGTPSSDDGTPGLGAANAVMRDLGEAIRDKPTAHTVAVRSTVLPGSTEDRFLPALQQHSGRKLGDGLEVCFNPEFLREGAAVSDFFKPPFIVIGAVTESGYALAEQMYEGIDSPVFRTSCRVAESVKYLCNAFQAMKIAFANEAGALLRSCGVDGRDAMKVCCEDRILNISTAYLRPGYAFGGSCLPKDLRAVMSMARDCGVELPMIGNILASNDHHIQRAADMVTSSGAKRVAQFGLAFKPGTDDLRESALLLLTRHLLGAGVQVKVFDPHVDLHRVTSEIRSYAVKLVPDLKQHMVPDIAATLDRADTIVVGHLRPHEVKEVISRYQGQTIIDLQGVDDLQNLKGAKYLGICW